QNGYWKHEGTATKQGSEYVAQVSHFSFWNCDIPGNWITLQGTINSTAGQPIPGATVTLNSQTNGTASDYTNAQGQFSGWVPAGQTLTMTVQVPCNGTNTTVLTQSIGPFSTNTTLSPIAVTVPGATQVTGTLVDCNNAAITNGYVIANGQVHFANAAGVFSFSTCGSGTQLYPYGGNPLTAGTPVQIPANGNMGNVTVCSGGGGGGTGTVTDIDGNTYNTVQIGTQEWMQENLKTTKYKNGDVIPTGLNNGQWEITTTGAWAYYNNSSQYNNPYGKLYNWYAVADPRGVCPTGWHVPTDSEWNQLVKYLDPQADTTIIGYQSQIAGGLMKSVGDLQSGTGLWQSPNTGGTNISGFTGLPGGYRNVLGNYNLIGYYGFWWSSSESSTISPWLRYLYYTDAGVNRNGNNKRVGLSVRCLRD
ncbi:MAG: FISUMP domain-containing protein, partial [Bacteroidota bacterium]